MINARSSVNSLVKSSGTALSSPGDPVEGSGNFNDRLAQMSESTSGSKSETAYYLKLQQQMMAESRFFNTVSNILKTRHDSAMAAIRNVR